MIYLQYQIPSPTCIIHCLPSVMNLTGKRTDQGGRMAGASWREKFKDLFCFLLSSKPEVALVPTSQVHLFFLWLMYEKPATRGSPPDFKAAVSVMVILYCTPSLVKRRESWFFQSWIQPNLLDSWQCVIPFDTKPSYKLICTIMYRRRVFACTYWCED